MTLFFSRQKLSELVDHSLPQSGFRQTLDCNLSDLLERVNIRSLSQAFYKVESETNPSVELRSAIKVGDIKLEDAKKNKNLVKEGKIIKRTFSDAEGHRSENWKQLPEEAVLWYHIKDYFAGRSVFLERHSGSEFQARPSDINFDLRLLGELIGNSFDEPPIRLYCCQAEESQMGTLFSGDVAAYRSRILPSDAAHYRLGAISSILPFGMYPREFYGTSGVGVMLALCGDPIGVKIQPFWSYEALEMGMQHLQELGRELAMKDGIARAELRGEGNRDFRKASALLAFLYESVAQHLSKFESAEVLSGLSAIAVSRDSKESYLCSVAFVSLNFSSGMQSLESASQSDGVVSKRYHRAVNILVSRDPWGFLKVSVKDCRTVPFYNLEWPYKNDDIIAPDVMEGLEDIDFCLSDDS